MSNLLYEWTSGWATSLISAVVISGSRWPRPFSRPRRSAGLSFSTKTITQSENLKFYKNTIRKFKILNVKLKSSVEVLSHSGRTKKEGPSSFRGALKPKSLKFGKTISLSTESLQKSFRRILREIRNDLTITLILSQRWVQEALLRIRDVYPGTRFDFIHPGSRFQGLTRSRIRIRIKEFK